MGMGFEHATTCIVVKVAIACQLNTDGLGDFRQWDAHEMFCHIFLIGDRVKSNMPLITGDREG